MKPIHLLFALFSFCLFNFNCKTAKITEQIPLFQCGDLKCSGKYLIEKYSFCSTIPSEKTYKVKIGKWQFWDTADRLLAEGIYEIEKSGTGIGGCPDQQLKLEKVTPQNWIFFDSKGNKIHPPLGFIEYLEQTDFWDIEKDTSHAHFKG